MQPASSINPSGEIEGFLDSLFEGQKGYVYCPSKTPTTGYWQTYFFSWPQDRTSIITHLLDQTKTKDVYVAPSLFKAPSDKKAAWKGSNYVWAEFDGNAPSKLPKGIPSPSIKIQSSEKGHEHWYWRLDKFETDQAVVSGLSKQLAYTLDADRSGWDSSQVLRPPGTIHHDSKRRTRVLLAISTENSLADFKGLVTPPESVVLNTNFENVPDSAEVVSKYKWPEEAYDLFKKSTQKIGSRSSAMTRLAFHCIEMGMTNEECYSILYNADERWKKFANREPVDRSKRLVGIITHCRGKKALESELLLSDREPFYILGDFLATEIKVKWLYKDFLAEQGLGILASAPGVGKSTLSLRLGFNVALGKDFLVWQSAVKEGKKVALFSLEMGHAECRKFIDDMLPSYSSDERKRLNTQVGIFPLGYAMALDQDKNQQYMLDILDQHGFEFIIIDSLKAATGLDEKRTDKFFDWMNKEIRNDRKITPWIIHHNRKPPNEGPRKPRGLEDLYGDTFITAHPTSVISLWPRSKSVLEVIPLKIRLAEQRDPFIIERRPYLDWEVTGAPVAVSEKEPEDNKNESKF